MRHQAVEAAIGGAHHDRDQLAVGGAQVLGRLVQLPEVGEPRAQALGTEGVHPEYVRDEAETLTRLDEQSPQAVRQLVLVGHREPRPRLSCRLVGVDGVNHRPVLSRAGVVRGCIRLRPASKSCPSSALG